MKRNYVVITVGKTHSGKTTFGKKLVKKLTNSYQLDQDVIAEFLLDKFSILAKAKVNKLKNGLYDPNIKFLLYKNILEFGIKNGFNIVATNGNIQKKYRDQLIKFIKRLRAKVIMVHFDFPEELLLDRIKNTSKSTKILIHSKTWVKSLTVKQKKLYSAPKKSEVDYFFQAKQVKDLDEIIKKIIKIVN